MSARSFAGTVWRMARRVFVRLGVALPAIWLILTMVFMLVHIVPGDPVQQMLGEDARAEDLNNLRHVLGLDQLLYTQYVHYMAGLVRGRKRGQPVSWVELREQRGRVLPTVGRRGHVSASDGNARAVFRGHVDSGSAGGAAPQGKPGFPDQIGFLPLDLGKLQNSCRAILGHRFNRHDDGPLRESGS